MGRVRTYSRNQGDTMTTEAQKRATAKYQKREVMQIILKLNRKTDADIIEILSKQDNRQGFIKKLIRDSIK